MLHHFIIRLFQKFYGLWKIENGYVVLLHLHVSQTKIIEVILWMRLISFSVNWIWLWNFILFCCMSTSCMDFLSTIFFIDPKCFHTLVHRILSNIRPSFKVCEQSKMLSDSWNINLFLEVDNVSTDISFVLKRSVDQGFSLSCIFWAFKILKHGFVRAEQHLEFTNINSLGWHGISTNEWPNNYTEWVLVYDSFI